MGVLGFLEVRNAVLAAKESTSSVDVHRQIELLSLGLFNWGLVNG